MASSLAEAIVTAATTAASGVMTTSNLTGLRETGEELFDRNNGGEIVTAKTIEKHKTYIPSYLPTC